MPGAMPQAEADIAPSGLTVFYGEQVDKCARFCSSQLDRYVPLEQITTFRGAILISQDYRSSVCGRRPRRTDKWGNATRGYLAPQGQPALDPMRLRGAEIVGNPYVF